MKLSVEIITGTFIDAEVSENTTVKELKEKIATEVKVSVKRLILVVGDDEKRRMVTDDEDEMKLVDLGLRKDSHVYLFFKHPDLVYKEERSQGRGDHAAMEISSESKRGNGEEEEEAKAKTDGEKKDKAMKNEEENRDVKVEDREDEKANGEETKDEDDVEDGKENVRDGEEGESTMDGVS